MLLNKHKKQLVSISMVIKRTPHEVQHIHIKRHERELGKST